MSAETRTAVALSKQIEAHAKDRAEAAKRITMAASPYLPEPAGGFPTTGPSPETPQGEVARLTKPTPISAAAIAREAVARAASSPTRPAIRAVTAEALLGMEFPPREMVLAPWLPTKGLAMLYGRRGLGKTHVALGIAYAVASGGKFLGWSALKPRRVVLIDGEMPASTLKTRLAEIADRADHEPPPDYISVIAADLQDRTINLAEPDDQNALAPFLEGAELVIVDNVSTLASCGRENEAESWLPIQEWALRQRREGRSVLFVHHAGKGGAQRGTSRREDVLDTVIALREPQDYDPTEGARFEVYYEKARGFHGDDAKPFEAALGIGGWTLRDLADADMARVTALKGDGLSIRDIGEELGLSKSKVQRLLQRAEAERKA